MLILLKSSKSLVLKLHCLSGKKNALKYWIRNEFEKDHTLTEKKKIGVGFAFSLEEQSKESRIHTRVARPREKNTDLQILQVTIT